MDLNVHLLIFIEVFNFILQSHSFIIIIGRLLHHYTYYLIQCTVCFVILYRLKLEKPNKSRVRKILGTEWGAYQYFGTGECPDSERFEVKVIGHRCCGLDAPENSKSALKRMNVKHIPMVEFDIIFTKDHIPIVFHDSTLYRMAGVSKNVSDMSLEELKEIDISVKHPFGENYRNERIPTLDEFVSACIGYNIRMILDLKIGTSEMVTVINNLYKKFPELYELALISSFNPFLIYQIRRNDPKIVSCLCWRPFYHSHEEFCGLDGPKSPRSSNPIIILYQRVLNILHYWFLCNIGYYIVGISGILLQKDAVTRESIRYWGKRDVRLIAWSVNLPSEKHFFENNLKITYLTDTVISN